MFSSCFLLGMVLNPSHHADPDGSTFHFLETTAHTLAATLGFLGLYENIQEEVYQHIISTIGHDRDPVSSIIRECLFNPNDFESTGLRGLF
jgi:hypothetical protein